jgi:hypothetical protein
MGKLKQKEDGLVSRIARAVAVVTIIFFLVNESTSVGHSKQIVLDFEKADEQTVRLPASAFRELPYLVRIELDRRGCTIPQVWDAAKPVNVIKGSFIRAGQIDWAALCSVRRISTILIFRNSTVDHVIEIGREADVAKLQGVGGYKIGYSREISAVGRDFIMRHYQAYEGVKPPPINHLGIDDAFVEKSSMVHYFYRGKWIELTGAD